MKQILFSMTTSKQAIDLPSGQQALLHYREEGDTATLTMNLAYSGAYGMGERFNTVNQKGYRVVNRVEEHFCFQGKHTYSPTPFFWTDTGLGLYVQTNREAVFDFNEETILISYPAGANIVLFTGTPESIIQEYQALFGPVKLPPKWAFAPWISANHWSSQADVEKQLKLLEQYEFPATVLVVEAWSDEATFYIFNGAKYAPKANGKALSYADFDFSDSPWPDPAGMIEKLHAAGVRFVLWQIPVYKKQGPDEIQNAQNDLDRANAAACPLCVMNADSSPYTIPDGHWFSGSMIPDFTNPETVKSWFDKRKYLLDIGVDGFKTDGGEFIYAPDVSFHDGSSGLEGKNRYPQSYTEAYTDFLGADHVLFSRSGYAGQHTTPIHWAGDQQSQNSELKGALTAGLSSALTGIPFWSFDIGGFAGPLPTADLYRRATQFGCFCPIMQWHSEPDGGQFRELMPGSDGNNERSPWNMAKLSDSPAYLSEMRFWHCLRMNLLPYLYSTAMDCATSGRPMMRPLVFDWANDVVASTIEDTFLLGDGLLVAPVLGENALTRRVYIPAGDWVDFYSHKRLNGTQWVEADCKEHIPVYVRCGHGIAFNLNKDHTLGSDVGNRTDRYKCLHFWLAGDVGTMNFSDDLGSRLTLTWNNGTVTAEGEAAAAYTWEFI